jgi:dipeptidase E
MPPLERHVVLKLSAAALKFGLTMRLYLSSFDIGDRPDELLALARGSKRAAVIVNALDNKPEQRAKWLATQTAKLVDLAFVARELDLRDYFARSEDLKGLLADFDMVWINGGNTFILRRAMQQSGFDAIIKEVLQRDEIVFAGFSAGTVIAAPSLRGLEMVDDPKDVPDGYEREIIWEGLGLVPFAIAVHFKSNHAESEGVDNEIAFYEKNAILYRTLRDGEALIIDGHVERVAGLSLG